MNPRRSLVASFLVASSACAQVILIPEGAVWRYLDDGSNQSSAWRGHDFDDSEWPAGPAQFGYGDGDEATTNLFGLNPSNKPITCYYRHRFHVEDPAFFTNLLLRLVRDDGAIVYLNGAEAFRNNMPAGPVSFLTPAPSDASPDATHFLPAMIDATSLVAGTNVMAVEIHQVDPASSDISFDLELTGNVPPEEPLIDNTSPDPGVAPLLEWTFNGAGLQTPGSGMDSTPLAFLSADLDPTDGHSAPGLGVSGLPTDRAFDNSVSTGMGDEGEGHWAMQSDNNNVDELRSLTLQGWYRAESGYPDNLARLYSKQSGSTGFLLLGSTGRLLLEINNVGVVSDGHYQEVMTWVFFAVVYVSVSWPVYPGGFVLENTRHLEPSIQWSRVVTPPMWVEGRNKHTFIIGFVTERFFRLAQP